MKLENLLQTGRKYLKRTLAAGLTASSIFFASCCIDPPPIPPEPPQENELSENTEVLPTAHLNNISSVEENSITFSTPVPYSSGDIIVCDISDATPNGLLRKVTSTSSDGKILYTKQASLEEAIKKTDVHFTTNSSKATEIPILSFEQNFDETILFDFDGNHATTYDQIIANGDLSGSLDLILDLKIDDGLEKFTFKTVINQDSGFEIRRGLGVPDLDYEFDILKKKFRSFTIGYIPTTPPFPITVTPSLDLCAGINGELPEEMTILQRASLTSGLTYEKDTKWDIISEAYGFWDCSPTSVADIPDFKIFAGPKLNILVYNIAGPYGEINAYVDKVSTDSYWELRVGSEVNLGARMRIFSWNIADSGKLNVLDNYSVRGEGEIEEEPEITTITIQPGPEEGKDAYVEIWHYTNADYYYGWGDSDYLQIIGGSEGAVLKDETLIQFPLSLIPSNANVTSAKLGFYGLGAFPGETPVITTKRITSPWDESTVKWDIKPLYGESVSDLTLSDAIAWYEWDITSLVKEWIGGIPNYGVALTTTYSRPGRDHAFRSSDYSADITKRPKLEVSYY
ncbi:DNRLRE domain-containing protein [Candidatus Pacearchaeota archaeon]|nr:DNRLRE domain-containing protein [Candidatus Pacearchaeota archaeon]